MDFKNSTAEKTTITRDLDDLSQPAGGNIYESIVVFSKRADQINTELKEELSSKLEEFASSIWNARM